jgi:hypothetical protein
MDDEAPNDDTTAWLAIAAYQTHTPSQAITPRVRLHSARPRPLPRAPGPDVTASPCTRV